MPVQVVSIDKDGARAAAKPKAAGVLPISTMSPSSVREAIDITPIALAPDGKVVTFAPPPPPASEPFASAQDLPAIERAKVVSALMPEQTPEPLAQVIAEPSSARGPWYIQIGAYAKAEQARDRLADARARAASILAKGNPVAEKWGKGRTEIYRARFAGFDEASAKHACEALKKSDFACFAAKN